MPPLHDRGRITTHESPDSPAPQNPAEICLRWGSLPTPHWHTGNPTHTPCQAHTTPGFGFPKLSEPACPKGYSPKTSGHTRGSWTHLQWSFWRGDSSTEVQTSVSFQWTSTPHFGHGTSKVERTRLARQAGVLQEGSTSPRASTAAHYAHSKQRQAVTPVVSHSGQEQPSAEGTGHRPPDSSWSLAGLLAR